MATYRDIFDTRDRLNPKIVERLRRYGNLEPPGVYGRPYNGGAKHGHEYPLSRANYLRLVTMQDEEHQYKDPRWVWQETAKKNGWVLKPTARAAAIEVYRKGEDGKVVPDLWKFYNVEDFKNYPYKPLEVKGDRPEDFRQAIGILKDNGIDVSWKAGSEQIFAAVKQYAKERGEDEFSAPMTAHLFLKTNYLSYDYKKHPLYTEAQLDKLANNNKIIFAAIKRAQNLYDKLESIQEKVQRQEQAVTEAVRAKEVDIKQEPVRKNGLFQDLYVDFAWSETPIRNEKGEVYKDGIHLNGEDAYNFLAAFNAMDKDVFNDKLRGVMGYNKVKMAVSYGKYHETEYKIRELGKLKLEVENTGPVMEGHAPSKMTYSGISAIDTVAKLKQQDLDAARTVRENGFIDRKTVEQQHLTLSYDKETLADIVFEEGCSRLTGDALGLKKAAEASEELQAVLECAIKMKGGADSTEIRALLNDEPVELPGFEERKNKVLADKPNSHALNKDLYRYYEKAALQDFMADTKEKVMAGMVKLMEDAGLRAVKIANIARTNPDFKPELLPERNSKPVGHQMTMEEQADKSALDAKRREQKNLIKAAAKAAQSKRISPKESLLQNVENAKSQIKQRELIK